MKATAVVVVGVMVTLAVGASAVRAQPADASSSAKAAAENVASAADSPGRFARFFDPEDGQLDLSYFLENPAGLPADPASIVTEPAVGYGGGVAGMFLRPRKEAGERRLGAPRHLRGRRLRHGKRDPGAFAGDASRWLDGRLRTLGRRRHRKVNLDFYGLGDPRA